MTKKLEDKSKKQALVKKQTAPKKVTKATAKNNSKIAKKAGSSEDDGLDLFIWIFIVIIVLVLLVSLGNLLFGDY